MKSEFLIDSLEFLDDALLIEAGEKRVNRKKIIFIRSAVAVAACLILLVIAGIAIGAPYGNNPKLLVGKDWRFLREEEIELPVETTKPQYMVSVTQTPEASLSPTEKVHTSKPATRPSVVVTNEPVSTDPVVNTETPVVNGTNPLPITTTMPSPTLVPDEDITEKWTSYIAKTEIEEGESEYGVEQNFVMAWFASALDMEYVEPTPIPTPEPTVVPAPGPTDEVKPTPTSGAVPEETKKPIGATEEPPTITQTPNTPNPTSSPATNQPEEPIVTVSPDSKDEAWEYKIKRGTTTYEWKKRNINSVNIGRLLEITTMNGTSEKGFKKSTTVSVYEINELSSDAAVAVKVNGRNGYYLFTNDTYTPESFKAFVTAYGLRNYLKWDSIAIYEKQILSTNVASNKVWKILNNADGKRVDARTVYSNNTLAGAIAMDIELFGYYDIPVALYKEGYIMFSLFGQTHAYRIGETTVTEILNEYK